MHAPIGHEPAGIIPEPAKVEMEAVGIEWAQRSGPEPEVIIDTAGGRAVGRLANTGNPIEINPAANDADFSKLTGLDEFDSLFLVLAAAPLRAHLDNPLM